MDPTLLDEHHKAIAHFVSLKALCDTYHCIQAIQNLSAGCSILAVEYSTPTANKITTSQAAVEATLSASLQTWFTCT